MEGRKLDWLIDALREPLVELANIVGLALLAAATARLRGKQRRAHAALRHEGLLPPVNKPSSSDLNTPLV